ncbi:MAG: 50S ribosomal protein L31 [Rickettsiaceae bacterium]|nr:50S ribosomal protein L31 [Rickettsiaceae bacterium]
MKKDIHPAYQPLKINIGKDVFNTASTLKSGEILMDVDFRKHPAWNKGAANVVNQSNKSVSDFNKKFAGLSFGAKK